MADQSTLAKLQEWFNWANQVGIPRKPSTVSTIDQTYRNPISQPIDNTVGTPAPKIANITKGMLNTAFPQATLLAGGANEIARRGKIADKYTPTDATPVQNFLIPSPAEEAARWQRIASPNTITRPEGTATFKPNTGIIQEPSIGLPQQIDRGQMVGTAARISAENPYGADVTSKALTNGQVRVGAATDAEAARNLQSRAEQDAAAADRVASYNRATESLRDLRAERMGIPRNALDVSEGRASPTTQAAPERDPFALPGDKFGDDVMRRNRLMSAIENPSGETSREKKRNQAAALETFKSFMEGGQQPATKSNEVDPINMGRFLLEQKNAESQLGLNKARLNIEQGTLAVKQAEAGAKQQEYNDKARKEFMETAQLPEGILPEYQSQILSSVDSMSQVTGGVIPREVMLADYLKFAEDNNINFKDMKPTNMLDLNKRFMEYQTSRYGSK